jgi:ABC-type sugar transport system permease subunit
MGSAVHTTVDRTIATQSQHVKGRRLKGDAWPYAFILPMVLCLGLVFAYPLITVVRNSFYTGSMGQTTFSGLENYRSLFQDPVFMTSLFNSLKLLVVVPIVTVVALIIALMLYEGTRGWRAYRLMVFVPYIIPATAIGISFSYLLQQNGIINIALRRLSLGFLAQDWIGNSNIVLFSIGGLLIWTQLGFGIVVFTASLLSLPKELSEAAAIDGATRWQTNRLVVLPQVRGTVEFFLVLQAIQVIAWTFPYVYVLTHGGPGNASSVMDLYVWRYAFQYSSPGLSSAAAVVLLLIAGVLIAIYTRLRTKQV